MSPCGFSSTHICNIEKNYFLEQIYSVEPNTILSLESAIYVLAQKRWSFQNRNSWITAGLSKIGIKKLISKKDSCYIGIDFREYHCTRIFMHYKKEALRFLPTVAEWISTPCIALWCIQLPGTAEALCAVVSQGSPSYSLIQTNIL